MESQLQLVHFQITKNCNLRCWFCGQWGKKGFFSDDKGEEVTYAKWLEIINELYDYGKKVGRLPDVMLWGGEPLVSPFFSGIANTLYDKGFNVGLVTNGVFLHSSLGVINRCFKVIYVSIDGVKEIHDSIRGQGVYDRVVENLKFISQNVEIRVMSVVTKSLLENFDRFINELSALNVDKLILQDNIYLSSEEAEEYSKLLKDNFNQTAESINGWVGESFNLRPLILEKLKKEYDIKIEYLPHNTVTDRPCLSCNNHIHIAWNGNLLFCTDFYDFSFGNAFNGSIIKQFNGETANKFRKVIKEKELPTCKHCSWKNSNNFYF